MIGLIRKAGLILRPDSEKAIRTAREAESFLAGYGIAAAWPGDMERAEHLDVILTFGGDGTFLAGARLALRFGAPLLGINLGTVGFLTEEEPVRLRQALSALLEGQYAMEERSLLQVQIPETGQSWLALNDAVLSRGRYARLIRVAAFVNDEQVGLFSSDGIIVATPTGSTGYSLSAGGPIVEPGMNCMILTPICSHSLMHIPCVVSDRSVVRLRLQRERNQTAELQIDGQNMAAIPAGGEVVITGTEQKVHLVRLHPYRFFDLVQKKLSELS
jgi:NAD+ kinase